MARRRVDSRSLCSRRPPGRDAVFSPDYTGLIGMWWHKTDRDVVAPGPSFGGGPGDGSGPRDSHWNSPWPPDPSMDLGSERFGLSTTHQRSHHDGRRIAGRPQGYPVMTQVTHRTALVVIPPGSAWPPIQAIRAEHDRKVGRPPRRDPGVGRGGDDLAAEVGDLGTSGTTASVRRTISTSAEAVELLELERRPLALSTGAPGGPETRRLRLPDRQPPKRSAL